jgi:2-dehydro-3-deoxyphosphogluconate aldolase/(4S)-4-hydroxy-2-oxoglutarate aldolase
VERCLDLEVAVIPGIATPTELETALAYELRLVKFFPAEAMGGTSWLKAIAGPYPKARFMPTGGIGLDRLGDYLALANVAAVGGSWIATPEALERGDFAGITARAAEAVALARGVRGSVLSG